MTVSFRDADGTTRLEGELLATGGATGDVLTQQADGTFQPAAGGGSLPQAVVVDSRLFTEVDGAGPTFAITAANSGTGAFTIVGDHTAALPVGVPFTVSGSTGNDGTYSVASSTFGAGSTVIVTNEGFGDNTADGTIQAPALYVGTFTLPPGSLYVGGMLRIEESWVAYPLALIVGDQTDPLRYVALANTIADDVDQYGSTFPDLTGSGSDATKALRAVSGNQGGVLYDYEAGGTITATLATFGSGGATGTARVEIYTAIPAVTNATKVSP